MISVSHLGLEGNPSETLITEVSTDLDSSSKVVYESESIVDPEKESLSSFEDKSISVEGVNIELPLNPLESETIIESSKELTPVIEEDHVLLETPIDDPLIIAFESEPIIEPAVESITPIHKDPVIGATVMLKGAQGVGTITDFDGKFLLEVENVRDAVLVISYIGYKNKHFPLQGRTVVQIALATNITELDEVIVVGYGAMRTSDLMVYVTSL